MGFNGYFQLNNICSVLSYCPFSSDTSFAQQYPSTSNKQAAIPLTGGVNVNFLFGKRVTVLIIIAFVQNKIPFSSDDYIFTHTIIPSGQGKGVFARLLFISRAFRTLFELLSTPRGWKHDFVEHTLNA